MVRWGFRMQGLITLRHFDVMAKIMLMASIVMGLSYATEWFMRWYGGEHAERSLVVFEFTGSYAPMFWALLLCNVIVPQALLVRGDEAECHRRCSSLLSPSISACGSNAS